MHCFLLNFLNLFFMLILLEVLFYACYGHGSSKKKVLLISLDGFRHDYFDISDRNGINLKNLKSIFHKGIKADRIENLFITRTFPNHMSIITGCYEESHGVIDNNFFDPVINETFFMKNVSQNFQSKWFNAVEPIWVTNQNNGHKSAVMYWPGQLAPFRDKYFPSYTFGLYNEQVNLNQKFDVMLNWLKDEDTTLGILYHPHPDLEGHNNGPNSSALLQVLSDIDTSFGYLLSSIERYALQDILNVIVVSDHGMSDISSLRRIFMDNYLDLGMYYANRQQSYTLWGLWPRRGVSASHILHVLSKVPHISAYLKEDIPSEWHYGNNRRVAPLIVIAEEGWIMVHNDNDSVTSHGADGYLISSENMKGIFFAWGPNIVTNFQSHFVVKEIDIFPLVAQILKLHSLPNINGSLRDVRWIVKNIGSDDSAFSSLIMVCVLALLCALIVCIVVSCAHYQAKSVRLQPAGKSYTLQTGKLLRRRQSDKDITWTKFNKNTKKKSKAAMADTAFLMEGSSDEGDDNFLGNVGSGVRKVTS